MAIVAALIIPGGMPIWQAHTEFCDRSSIYKQVVTEDMPLSDEPLRDFRMNCLIGSAIGSVLQLVYGIALKSMVLLSNAFLVGSALCLASVFVNVFLVTCCSNQSNRLDFVRPPAFNPTL